MGAHQAYELKQYQSLPLDAKVRMTQQRIREWYDYWDGNVYVSYSGGKDSTVLLHLVREIYPDVPAVFSDTGLEYPEIRKFAMKQENVTIVRPSIIFTDVIKKYGYPLVSKEVAEAIYFARRIGGGHTQYSKRTELKGDRAKENRTPRKTTSGGSCETGNEQTNRHINSEEQKDGSYGEHGYRRRQLAGVVKSMFNKEKWLKLCQMPIPISHYCCFVMKKSPIKKFQRSQKIYPYIGTLADESLVRKQAWMRHGCNAYESASPSSQPMSFWTEQDVLQYIVENNLEICSVYGDIVYTDPDGMEYAANEFSCGDLKCSGCQRTGCVFCGFGAHIGNYDRFIRLKETHPQLYDYCMRGGQWAPNPAYVPDAPEYDGEWKNWNPKEIWIPSKEGLGMRQVFEMINEEYGKEMFKI